MNTKYRRRILGSAAALIFGVAALPLVGAGTQATNSPALGRLEKAGQVVGDAVKNGQGQTLGKLEDLVVDLESGRVLYGVVAVDANYVAVAPEDLSPVLGAKTVIIETEKNKLAGAPRVNKKQAAETATVNFLNSVYQYWNRRPWWEGAMQPTGHTTFGNVNRASELKGMGVKTPVNENLGKVDDIVVELPGGRVPFSLLSASGVAGASQALYPVPPNEFTPGADRKNLITGLDIQKLLAAPRIPKDNLQQLSDPAFAASIYQYYGKQPYWKTPPVSPTGR